MGDPADGGAYLWAIRRAAVNGDVPTYDAASGLWFPSQPAPPPPTPAQCGPMTFVDVNGDTNPAELAYETQYNLNNDSGDEPQDYILQLPEILPADVGRCIWLYTCYANDPMDADNFGHAQIQPFAGDFIKLNGANLGQSPDNFNLTTQNDALKLFHDGVANGVWYFGN
jgi:chitodextrinase